MGAGPNGARLEGAVTAFANLFNDEFQQKKKVKPSYSRLKKPRRKSERSAKQ